MGNLVPRVESLLAHFERVDELSVLEARLKKMDLRFAGLNAAGLAAILLGIFASKLIFLILLFLAQFVFTLHEQRKKLSTEIDAMRDELQDEPGEDSASAAAAR